MAGIMKTLGSLLLAMLVTACVMTSDDLSEQSAANECDELTSECDGGGDDPPPPPPPPPPPDEDEGPVCQTQDGAVVLDQAPANIDNADGKVTFCHATSSAQNPFVVITTSINACKAHEDHRKLPKGGLRDVFPTGGCAD
jgi:hypothetical protein